MSSTWFTGTSGFPKKMNGFEVYLVLGLWISSYVNPISATDCLYFMKESIINDIHISLKKGNMNDEMLRNLAESYSDNWRTYLTSTTDNNKDFALSNDGKGNRLLKETMTTLCIVDNKKRVAYNISMQTTDNFPVVAVPAVNGKGQPCVAIVILGPWSGPEDNGCYSFKTFRAVSHLTWKELKDPNGSNESINNCLVIR